MSTEEIEWLERIACDEPLVGRLLEERKRLLGGIKLLLMCSLPSDVSGERMVQQARAAIAYAESPAPLPSP